MNASVEYFKVRGRSPTPMKSETALSWVMNHEHAFKLLHSVTCDPRSDKNSRVSSGAVYSPAYTDLNDSLKNMKTVPFKNETLAP